MEATANPTAEKSISLHDARLHLKKIIKNFHGSYSNEKKYISHGKIKISGHEGEYFYLIHKDDENVMYGVHTVTGETLALKNDKK